MIWDERKKSGTLFFPSSYHVRIQFSMVLNVPNYDMIMHVKNRKPKWIKTIKDSNMEWNDRSPQFDLIHWNDKRKWNDSTRKTTVIIIIMNELCHSCPLSLSFLFCCHYGKMCAKPNDILCPIFPCFCSVPLIHFFFFLPIQFRSRNLCECIHRISFVLLLIQKFMPLQLFLQLHGIVSVGFFYAICAEDKWEKKTGWNEKKKNVKWMNEWKWDVFFKFVFVVNCEQRWLFLQKEEQPLNLGQHQWMLCIMYTSDSWLVLAWLVLPCLTLYTPMLSGSFLLVLGLSLGVQCLLLLPILFIVVHFIQRSVESLFVCVFVQRKLAAALLSVTFEEKYYQKKSNYLDNWNNAIITIS